MACSADIYSALSARAYAQQTWPTLGFNDQAARALARLLGITVPLHNNPMWERHCLLRSQWFDERCRLFFKRYPEALCIDLGAGLSTRFHRLSELDDWPRFSWVDVDLPELTRLKSDVIPQIDNYRLLAANIIQDDWLAASGWHPRTPLIITLESVLSDMSMNEILNVFSIIARHCTSESKVEIVFDYRNTNSSWRYFFSPHKLAMRKIKSYLKTLGLLLRVGDTTHSDENDYFFVAGFNTRNQE